MNKILIICTSTSSDNGGYQCIERNIDSIIDIYGKSNTEVFRIKGKKISVKKLSNGLISRLKEIVKGYYGGLDWKQENKIIQYIKNKQITTLYIDGSFYGRLAKVIKSKYSTIKIVTFFHNCEFEYSINALRANKNYLSFYNPLLAFYNEWAACKYSDEIIVLNNRDKEALTKHYGRSQCFIIPITFKPWYTPQNIDKETITPLKALFVGSYFYGNIEGLKWFCKYILPNVNINLTIVGSGMDKLLSEIPSSNKLNIHGKVPELVEYYENADFVILPILSGGGMKVKTAEALMFGKYIVGTPEAFTGYEINNSVATVCSSAQEFINTLNILSLKMKYNKGSRELFEKNYSYNNSLEIFKKVFNNINE